MSRNKLKGTKQPIKPCPYCGNEAKALYSHFRHNWWSVCCENCPAELAHRGSRKEIIAEWNDRAERKTKALDCTIEDITY